jgi:hypothetical protein
LIVAGAADFMVGNAPAGANYAAPLLNFAPIANAPQDLFQGQQRARTTRLQNAFPDGLPKNSDGSIDIGGMTDTLTKLGGAEYASQMLPLLMQGQMGQAGANAIQSTGDPNSAAPPANANVPGASGPANIRGPQRTSSAPGSTTPGQPQLSTVGADNNGSDTVRSVATEAFGGKDVSPLIPRFASALGVDPDAPLNPQQVAQARAIMSRTAQNTSPGVASDAGNGTAAAPTPVGGASGAPAPNGAIAAPVAHPVAPSGGGSPSAASSLVPQGYQPGPYANALTQRAMALRTQAARVASFSAGAAQAKVLQEQAQAYDDRAKQIFDSLNTANQPTNTQKDVATGADLSTAVNQAAAKRSAEVYSGIQGSANQFETGLKPYLDISRSILNDPRVYTGAGGNLSLDLNRVRTMFGDSNAAVLQEALQKTTASSVLAQINQQKNELMESGGPGSSGRIFQQQVELVEKAAPQLSTTPAGNRFLVEVAGRMGDLATQIRDQAANYLQTHKVLDANFDKQVSDYLKSNPVFNKDELSNPALLGAPSAPPNINNPRDAAAWAQGMGLQKGDPIRVNGKYKYYQGAPAAQQ